MYHPEPPNFGFFTWDFSAFCVDVFIQYEVKVLRTLLKKDTGYLDFLKLILGSPEAANILNIQNRSF